MTFRARDGDGFDVQPADGLSFHGCRRFDPSYFLFGYMNHNWAEEIAASAGPAIGSVPPARRGPRRARSVVFACALLAFCEAGAAGQSGVPAHVTFTDVTASAGIDFRHDNGAAGDYRYPELFGGGVAVLEVDGDGWPDLLFVNGRGWRSPDATRHGLFRNNRDGTSPTSSRAAAWMARTSTPSVRASPTTTTTATTTSS